MATIEPREYCTVIMPQPGAPTIRIALYGYATGNTDMGGYGTDLIEFRSNGVIYWINRRYYDQRVPVLSQ